MNMFVCYVLMVWSYTGLTTNVNGCYWSSAPSVCCIWRLPPVLGNVKQFSWTGQFLLRFSGHEQQNIIKRFVCMGWMCVCSSDRHCVFVLWCVGYRRGWVVRLISDRLLWSECRWCPAGRSEFVLLSAPGSCPSPAGPARGCTHSSTKSLINHRLLSC